MCSHGALTRTTALLLLSAAAGSGCQVRTGYSRAQLAVERQDAVYRADAYAGFQALLRGWAEAVNVGDADTAASLYTPDARVELHRVAEGVDVPVAVREWLADVGTVLLGPADFDFSEKLAYGTVRILVVPQDGGARSVGMMVVVARQSGTDWLIRSQLLDIATR